MLNAAEFVQLFRAESVEGATVDEWKRFVRRQTRSTLIPFGAAKIPIANRAS